MTSSWAFRCQENIRTNLGDHETTSAANARIRRSGRPRHGSAPTAVEEKRSPRRDLPNRPQHQLHEFLHGVLLLLRVLPPARRERRLHPAVRGDRSEEHTSELQSRVDLVCRLLLEKKKQVST